jgi:hypothetical protein
MNALPEAAIRKSRFDFFGFTALSLAIAANWWALFRSDAHA